MFDEIKRCSTPQQIERFFQAAIKKKMAKAQERKLYRACNQRAVEIAGKYKFGRLLPTRMDKGRGCSARYSIDGEAYHTGTWGNGAGYRWAMAGFEEWATEKLAAAGVRPRRNITNCISWVRTGYHWRALRSLLVGYSEYK